MKKKLSMFLLAFTMILGIFPGMSSAQASEKDKNAEDIQEMRTYLETTVPELVSKLKGLDNKNASLEAVDKVISSHYQENPAPEAVKNPNISLSDVFPEKAQENANKDDEKVLNLNEFIQEKKGENNSNDGELISLNNSEASVDVYVGDTGEMFVLERKKVKKAEQPLIANAGANDGLIGTNALPWEYTDTERTTGIAYNAYGGKLFHVWAEGQFKYNGTSVQVQTGTGSYGRYALGSTITLERRVNGGSRFPAVGSETYAEVYTQTYFESVYGIRWAGLVLKSGTCEVYVGASKMGHMYGSATLK
ncbi:hypothetical protein [Bacillus sp. AG4(2022)]|uniref:hypothetical protein n=1 Tax=Bacillus sp. AG4(2022) TaxID=2962594 RepID=UPI002882C28C|nr:hypothetical protein [Bacillus sp. AG4(2022)]MDT0163580.1 hypothetical protein [Bacillus sp. AG4(2022)]